MLRSVNEIIGYRLYADGKDFGYCKDFLFDDRWWTIRHIEANTGSWLASKMVLVSPIMIEKADWKTRNLFLNVSRKKIEDCPSPAEDEPVSREHEKRIHRHYSYPYYWANSGLWGPAALPAAVLKSDPDVETAEEGQDTDDDQNNHLRSFNEIKGYDIKAMDGDIGHVQDLILDDETWALRHVVVDTRNWLPGGRKVILSLNWAESVSWTERAFEMNLHKEEIQNGPEFDPEAPVNMEYETQLYDYYGRPFEKNIDKQLQQHIGIPFR